MPSFNPDEPTSAGEYKISITCSTQDAQIFYEISDDAYTSPPDPTESSNRYSSPVSTGIITKGAQIKARAYKEGMLESDIAEYTIPPSERF